MKLTIGVRSAVRTLTFPDYPKPEFIGLNGAGGFVMKKDIPPSIPIDQKEAMNFLFGKNAFFGFGPASDGVRIPPRASFHLTPKPSAEMDADDIIGHDVVDELGHSKGIYS